MSTGWWEHDPLRSVWYNKWHRVAVTYEELSERPGGLEWNLNEITKGTPEHKDLYEKLYGRLRP